MSAVLKYSPSHQPTGLGQTRALIAAANDNCHLHLVASKTEGICKNLSRSPALLRLTRFHLINGVGFAYNTHGFMTGRTLPSGRVLATSYDGLGRASVVADASQIYASGMSYHASGPLTSMTYGNGQVFSQTLNARLQPLRTSSVKASNVALDLTYSYDIRGKVSGTTNAAITGDNRTYSYDDLGRLTSATGSWGTGAYTYDALGNMRTKTVGGRALVMAYDSDNKLTSHTDTVGGARSLSYDARGNVTALGGLNFTYDMSGQPTAISGTGPNGAASGTYTYDGNLKRVKSTIGGKTIYNVFDAGGTLTHIDAVTDGKATDYIGKIARITTSGGTDTVTYLHADQLGSANTGTDASGLVLWREQYTPFGTTLTSPIANNDQAGFTGHIKDSATGLNYMQARYYDPLIGRFLSIDPIGFSVARPEMFGRYTYVNNDPVNLIDPFGEESFLISRPIGITGGAANHSFVVVVNVNKGYLHRYSYGPSGASPVKSPGKLVSHSGSRSSTDLDDASAMMTFFRDQVEASQNGIQAVRIDASDESVITAGEAMNATLGTIESPGENAPNYNILPGGSNTEANSNTAAVAIPNNARQMEGKPANQRMPTLTNNPGRNSNWSIKRGIITGTRSLGSRIKLTGDDSKNQ